jgi:murein L,D-transpeptidase YafK
MKITTVLTNNFIMMLLCMLLVGCGSNSNKLQVEETQVQESSQLEDTQTSETIVDKIEPVTESNTESDNTSVEEVDNQEQVNIDEINQEQDVIEGENQEQQIQVIEQASSDELVNIEAGEQDDMETKILVYKADRKLELWQNGELSNSFQIGLGKKSEGKKEKEGDLKTPEGTYYVCTRNQYSKFYLSLGVSYPNIDDAAGGLSSGVIDESTYQAIESAISKGECPPWNTALGGEIMIHGHGGSKDWTKGCIALDDEVMDILWEACPIGTQIIIYP